MDSERGEGERNFDRILLTAKKGRSLTHYSILEGGLISRVNTPKRGSFEPRILETKS